MTHSMIYKEFFNLIKAYVNNGHEFLLIDQNLVKLFQFGF